MAPDTEQYDLPVSSIQREMMRNRAKTATGQNDSALSVLEAHTQALAATLEEFEKKISPLLVSAPETGCLSGGRDNAQVEPARSEVEHRIFIVAGRINAVSTQIARLNRNITRF